MDELTKKAKIERFLGDSVMSQVIKSVLEQSFTKASKDRDASVLAARFLALELLGEAWKELERYKNREVAKESGEIKYV